MRYLTSIFEYKVSIVDKKIELLNDLSLELKDIGLEIDIWKEGRDIILHISDELGPGLLDYYNGEELYNAEFIKDFEETLKSYNMNFRSKTGSSDRVYYKFDKWGSMTDKYFKTNESISSDIQELLDNLVSETFDEFDIHEYKYRDGYGLPDSGRFWTLTKYNEIVIGNLGDDLVNVYNDLHLIRPIIRKRSGVEFDILYQEVCFGYLIIKVA